MADFMAQLASDLLVIVDEINDAEVSAAYARSLKRIAAGESLMIDRSLMPTLCLILGINWMTLDAHIASVRAVHAMELALREAEGKPHFARVELDLWTRKRIEAERYPIAHRLGATS